MRDLTLEETGLVSGGRLMGPITIPSLQGSFGNSQGNAALSGLGISTIGQIGGSNSMTVGQSGGVNNGLIIAVPVGISVNVL
jgi:hypothetical protein